MKRILITTTVILTVGIVAGLVFGMLVLLDVAMLPLAIQRAPTAIMHAWRDMSWALAVVGLVLSVVLPVVFVRARIDQYRRVRESR